MGAWVVLVFSSLIGAAAIRCETSAATAQSNGHHPAVTAFFESGDPFVQEVVLPNIEANRKSDGRLDGG